MARYVSFLEHPTSGTLIKAFLGPTNTGKTHRSIQRLLELKGGLIGLPLRLLAREVYVKLLQQLPSEQVALITGEEKIVPDNARYFVTTVESMPMDITVPIVIVDEIQLANHPVRGHVFTDRLLNARGMKETWFLGSDTIAPLLQRLVPTASIERLDRLSQLKAVTGKRLSALPKRTAIVAFSVPHLYEIAEQIRVLKGGVAVVMGAMSPQSRNRQVELFQSGRVDYLVATDAIGMGLNLDIRHVVFASRCKYDGKEQRWLTLAEMGQIAGRAGRHHQDGSFSLSPECARRYPMPQSHLQLIERQSFMPVRRLYYRNSKLSFDCIESFWDSLHKSPFAGYLQPMRGATDERAMSALLSDPELSQLKWNEDYLSFLWSVCQVPDYRRDAEHQHHKLLRVLYRQLTSGTCQLDEDWVSRRILRLGNLSRDIPQLLRQLNHLRTWGYIAHRSDWIDDAEHWRGQISALEEKLSETLHQRLTQRFIDDLSSALVERPPPEGVHLIDHTLWSTQMRLGWLVGLSFQPNPLADGIFGRSTVRKLGVEYFQPIAEQLARLMFDGSPIEFGIDLSLEFSGLKIARLKRGVAIDQPLLQFESLSLLPARQQRRFQEKIRERLSQRIEELRALSALPQGGALSFALKRHLGVVPLSEVDTLLSEFSPLQIKHLQRQRIWKVEGYLLSSSVYKRANVKLRLALAALWCGEDSLPDFPSRMVSPIVSWSKELASLLGYRMVDERAVRKDVLFRLKGTARSGLTLSSAASQLGVRKKEAKTMLTKLGFRVEGSNVLAPQRRRGAQHRKRVKRK